jgi:hypothetical protein
VRLVGLFGQARTYSPYAASAGVRSVRGAAARGGAGLRCHSRDAGLVSDQTCVTGLTVSRGRARTEVQAQVQDSCATGQRSFGKVSGQVAEVYYHPRGSTTWSLLGQARTDTNGFVDYTSGDALRGYFKVVFPAQGYYLGSTSQTG